MGLPNLSGSNIQDTFQRVLHTDGNLVYDGTGSALPISFESGNISASGDIYAHSYFVENMKALSKASNSLIVGNASAFNEIQLGTSAQTNRIDLQGNVTASGNISASGDIIANSSEFLEGNTVFPNKSGNGYKYGGGTTKRADSGFISDGVNAKTHITPQHTLKPMFFLGHQRNTSNGDVYEYPNNYITYNKKLFFNPNEGGGGIHPTSDKGTFQVEGNLQVTQPAISTATGSTDPKSGVLITANPNIYFFSSDASGSISGSHQITSASAQIKFDTGSNALKVFAGSTNEDLLEVMHISRSGANPRVGIGTDNPLKTFDFKSVSNDSRGGELLIRGSRTTKGADPNDEVGRINFAIDSSSFDDITTSGSAAEIVALVDDVDQSGIEGHLSFRIADSKIGAPVEILKLSGSTSKLNSPLDLNGTLDINTYDINASTINRYNNTSTRIELAANHLEFYGNAYGMKISNTGIDANPSGLANMDFRVRSDNDDKIIYVDSGLDSIQLGNSTNTHITASGNISSSGTITATSFVGNMDGGSF
jgi:hypothetical protein